MKRQSAKAGITKSISPHTFRHTFASELYRETKDIMIVMRGLGHADVSTTMIYTHIMDSELENAMKSFRAPGGGTMGLGTMLNSMKGSFEL